MTEILLEEFEDFYKEKLESQFYKVKKAVKKQISEIRENLLEIKVCTDHFLEAGEGKIEEKALKSLHFFSDKIRKEIDEIEIPDEDITYDAMHDLLNSIKKLFININDIAKKSVPKFQKQLQSEIKELSYITRKLGNNQKAMDEFLRKKYSELKDAEYLLKKLPKIYILKENIEHAKADLENFEKELEERQKEQEDLTQNLTTIEKNEMFGELDKAEENLAQLRMKINNKFGFKKALKKLKFELEKDTMHIPNVNVYFLTDFLKNPINALVKESRDLPKFLALLVQLRHVLEENKLNLKTDVRDKTVQQINAIFDEKSIQDDIDDIKKVNSIIDDVKKRIEQNGLAVQREDIKNKISTNTVKLEHLEHDLDRKNKDYLRYLSALKTEREEIQNSITKVINQDIKININFNF
jgi:predicted  nucleic acid-binding Zn-ribbon protein